MRHALALLALFLAGPAQATLIRVNLFRPGDELVTRDTVTGLDWLDLDADGAYLLSYAEIEAGAGGWVAAGWRHATKPEVASLLAQASGTPYGVGILIGLLGWTDFGSSLVGPAWSAANGYYDDGDGPLVGFAGIHRRSTCDNSTSSLTRQPCNTITSSGMADNRYPTSAIGGHFLVRAVPEPQAAALLALGLAGIAWRRSRKRSR